MCGVGRFWGSYFLWLWQDDDCHSPCVDALHSRGEADLGDPLNPMGTTLMLQPLVHILASDPCSGMVQTA